ncbi:MAG: carboxylating nicotinate-nucleotide diphosphorylase, partial [Deltaproteobacteria bacterium]|nr:carboxylating nicotinate-nucleotide diphosphorylase [Deltaproteobacteria bacterium]
MHSIDHLVEIALAEDIGPGDITTDNLVGDDLAGRGEIIAKEPAVLTGLDIARKVFEKLDPAVRFTTLWKDGDSVQPNDSILVVCGALRGLLAGERTALNFLQRLSGIATQVQAYVAQLGNRPVRLVDTRKTTPGLRVLEKYAVRMGGAQNHRMGLYDGVLVKDNHIAACGGIDRAVTELRRRISHLVKIEVEAATIEEVQQAVKAGADVIMLDNMDLDTIGRAVKLIDGQALVEVSGSVTIDNLTSLADTGVDIISVGALTHSAR